ncbi:MAG: response regulator [Candidatus Doudnabacteria bacterium]|nr:response regulator [Candidatus Doudnabacteria bacterium]
METAVQKIQHVIMLVDDEAAIRNLGHMLLTQAGYNVLLAKDSKEALRIFADVAGRVDIVVCDVVMPGTSGIVLAKQLLSEVPGLKVVIMSGYSDEETHLRIKEVADHAVFLRKPFRADALLGAIQTLITA